MTTLGAEPSSGCYLTSAGDLFGGLYLVGRSYWAHPPAAKAV